MSLVFLVVTAAWLLFKFPDFSQALVYVRCIVQNRWDVGFPPRVFSMLLLCLPVIAYHGQYLLRQFRWPFSRLPIGALVRPLAYGLMLFLILTNSANSGDFIYFQF